MLKIGTCTHEILDVLYRPTFLDPARFVLTGAKVVHGWTKVDVFGLTELDAARRHDCRKYSGTLVDSRDGFAGRRRSNLKQSTVFRRGGKRLNGLTSASETPKWTVDRSVQGRDSIFYPDHAVSAIASKHGNYSEKERHCFKVPESETSASSLSATMHCEQRIRRSGCGFHACMRFSRETSGVLAGSVFDCND